MKSFKEYLDIVKEENIYVKDDGKVEATGNEFRVKVRNQEITIINKGNGSLAFKEPSGASYVKGVIKQDPGMFLTKLSEAMASNAKLKSVIDQGAAVAVPLTILVDNTGQISFK